MCMVHKLGYGSWEELKAEIRNSWRFRFDWFFKSRTPLVQFRPLMPIFLSSQSYVYQPIVLLLFCYPLQYREISNCVQREDTLIVL